MNKIKKYREKAGITQVELARRTRMAASNVNALERGRLTPWPKATRRLVRVLKCSEGELFPERKKWNGNGN